jgi:predicted nuclease with TOPRIM domain
MNVKTGIEIVRIHTEIQEKVSEIETAMAQLAEYGYTQTVLREQLTRLKGELQTLEATRFQALEPVVVVTSTLGGKSKGI